MCGIIGAVSERNIEKILLEGLKRLEYRGYDSAGLAVISVQQKLERLRSQGKVAELENSLSSSTLQGYTGIAHTRWATHGLPSEQNAHPLLSHNEIALVHNGIIENHEALRNFLIEQGYSFDSQTDSETVVHLIHYFLKKEKDLLIAVQKTIAKLEGSYALGIISLHDPGRLICVRQSSPMVLGKGINENFFSSDPLALLPVTDQFIYLMDGDIADIKCDTVEIYAAGTLVQRPIQKIELQLDTIERGDYKHYMSKEIFAQPHAIQTHLEGRIDKEQLLETAFGFSANQIFQTINHVQLVACGTSYHAAMVARYWLEALADISCSVEVASEFRYRKVVVPEKSLFVSLSQSGETADTLAALRLAKKIGFLSTLAICNVPESSLVRESDLHFMTRAGVEMGVAATKTFTTQLTALLMLSLALGKTRQLKLREEKQLVSELQKLPKLISQILELNNTLALLAKNFVDKEHVLFLGRGNLYPIALEGALKLKEISYIHAEGYAGGELKHGPLALVDKNMPVIALAPTNELSEKTTSNLYEVLARGGELYVFTDNDRMANEKIPLIKMPLVDSVIAPLVYTVPLQLLAYHVAVLKGTDVDQPRNLAKSVTVE